MTTTTKTTWIRRVAAGAVLAAAPALIALGTATSSHADSTGPNFNSPIPGNSSQQDWSHSSWIHRHQDQVQSWYQTP